MQLILRNLRQLVTVAAHGAVVKTQAAMRDIGVIEDAALLAEDGLIRWCGQDSAFRFETDSDACVIDASGLVALPGFVEAHTHLVFAGSRDNEFAMRSEGRTYQQIAAEGGGILSTVQAVRRESKDDLKRKAKGYLDAMMGQGTTTVEVKSGYGLDLESEVKMLEVIKELADMHAVDLVSTFLGAHAFPLEYHGKEEEYIDLLCDEMLPYVQSRQLATFCDVFCEYGYFTVEQSRTILRTARTLGFKLKVHADELSASGGSLLAAEMGAVSADHLEHISAAGIQALQQAGVVAVLLPGVDFFLAHPYADARTLIEAGVPVALATDFNPGSCMSYSIPLMMTLACTQMKMVPEEAITACTINAAAALSLSDRVGSLEPGKQADIILCRVPHYRYLAYHFGENHVIRVFKNGLPQDF